MLGLCRRDHSTEFEDKFREIHECEVVGGAVCLIVLQWRNTGQRNTIIYTLPFCLQQPTSFHPKQGFQKKRRNYGSGGHRYCWVGD